MLSALVQSNMFQMITTTLAGGGVILLLWRKWESLRTLGYVLSGCLLVAAIFSLGEVYVYGDYYRRTFFILTDQITTVLSFFLLYSLVKDFKSLVFLASLGVFLSGGKASIILMLLMAIILFMVHWNILKSRLKFFAVCLFASFFLSFGINKVSMEIQDFGPIKNIQWPENIQLPWYQPAEGQAADGEAARLAHRSLKTHMAMGSCETIVGCIETQLLKALAWRYFSSTAGLWMTLQGGYRGEAYPATAGQFAELMVQANPWGINDRYNLDYRAWRIMGAVQNPYLRFGSGYGPWLLGGLILGVLAMSVLAVRVLLWNTSIMDSLFASYFLVNVIVNQTQSWLTSGSMILMLLGACGLRIIWVNIEHARAATPG